MWNRRHIDVHQPTYEENTRDHSIRQNKKNIEKKLKKNHPWLLEREMRGEFSESEYSIQTTASPSSSARERRSRKKNP